MKPTYILTLTSSQRMALVSILGEAMAKRASYVDCSQSPTVETRAADLFQLAMGLDPVETLQTAPSAPQELQDWRELSAAYYSMALPENVRPYKIWPNKWHQDCAVVAFALHKWSNADEK